MSDHNPQHLSNAKGAGLRTVPIENMLNFSQDRRP